MSDRDEKKPLDDDETRLPGGARRFDRRGSEFERCCLLRSPPVEDDSLEPLELVGDAAEAGTETAAEPPDKGLDFVADEAEEIVGDAERRVEEAVDTARKNLPRSKIFQKVRPSPLCRSSHGVKRRMKKSAPLVQSMWAIKKWLNSILSRRISATRGIGRAGCRIRT